MSDNYALLVDCPPTKPKATLIMSHGAGAPMDSGFMNQLTAELTSEGVKLIRFEFPYMQQRRQTGSRRPPDRQPKLLESWQQVVVQVKRQQLVEGKLFIGGKSMGGRMATLIADELGVSGICCFGFPFFPKRKDGARDLKRVAHLATLKTPCLIVQGTRDSFGTPDIVENLDLSATISVEWLEDGDHDLKPRVRSGLTQAEHLHSTAKLVKDFVSQL